MERRRRRGGEEKEEEEEEEEDGRGVRPVVEKRVPLLPPSSSSLSGEGGEDSERQRSRSDGEAFRSNDGEDGAAPEDDDVVETTSSPTQTDDLAHAVVRVIPPRPSAPPLPSGSNENTTTEVVHDVVGSTGRTGRKGNDGDDGTTATPSSLTIYLSLTSSPSPSRIPLILTGSSSGSSVVIASSMLRRRVSDVTSVPIESMRLIYRGRIIVGEGMDVTSEYGLVDGCVVHVVGRPMLPSSLSSSQTAISPPASRPAAVESRSRDDHPGLRGFYDWRADVASLYRIYAIPFHGDDDGNRYHPAILPMRPSSERGRVGVYLEVTNLSSRHDVIDVYWIDHSGNEVMKGSIRSGGGTWTQFTYIGHPWTFRVGPREEDVLLRYVPFRIVSSIVGAETLHSAVGAHRFSLRDVPDGHVVRNNGDAGVTNPVCWIHDELLPETPPVPRRRFPDEIAPGEIRDAVVFSCQQIRREDVVHHGNGIASAKLLLRYLQNIRTHPAESKYRHIRIGNPAFRRYVYDTGARGVLLALGFVESYGRMECGTTTTLDVDRVRQMEDAIAVVNETLRIMESGVDAALVQPDGGDGYGRAGFGRAGEMST